MTDAEITERVNALIRQFSGFHRAYVYHEEYRRLIGDLPPGTDAGTVDARVMKALLVWTKGKLDADPTYNRFFDETTPWKVLNQLLAAARLKELARARSVRRNRNVDCGDLADTFYGRKVLMALGFNKRRIFTKDEYTKIAAEFERIKLVLPETIEPTFTERFFAGDL